MPFAVACQTCGRMFRTNDLSPGETAECVWCRSPCLVTGGAPLTETLSPPVAAPVKSQRWLIVAALVGAILAFVGLKVRDWI
jgi:hypothetical protein